MIQPMTVMDDIRLSAVLETPEGAPEGGPLAILLHGLTSAKDRPHTLLAAQAMREAGFATLRFDLYGHGESGGEFRKHTLPKWISNTLAVIDHVRGLGYTDLWLSGHSQGGLVAALAGAMERDRVRGLILRAPAFMIPRGAREGSLLGRDFDPDHIPDDIPVIKGLTLEGNYLRTAQAIRGGRRGPLPEPRPDPPGRRGRPGARGVGEGNGGPVRRLRPGDPARGNPPLRQTSG